MKSDTLLEVQRRLQLADIYTGALDNDYGPKTAGAIEALFLYRNVTGWEPWAEGRRIIAAGQTIVEMEGFEAGKIDGLMGPQTSYAFERYDEAARGALSDDWRIEKEAQGSITVPPAAAAQWPRQSSVRALFGDVGTRQTKLVLPYPMRLAWDLGATVRSFQCHELVAQPLARIFGKTLEHYGQDQIRALKLDLFGGCLAVRKKRGGSTWSMHAWGIAVDIDPERNALKMGRDKATLDGPAYDAFWRFVEGEGAVSLGRQANFDWMHFQFARL